MGRKSAVKLKPLTESEVDGLLSKLSTQSALCADDCATLQGVVQTWAHLFEVAAAPQASIRDIRRILGLKHRDDTAPEKQRTTSPIVPALAPDNHANSEDAQLPSGNSSEGDEGKPKRRHEHGRRPHDAMGKMLEAHHRHTALHTGDLCPDCIRGRLYKYGPNEFTTISGRAPLVATRHQVECLQCNLCKQVFKAPLPEELIEDGIQESTLYSHSAVAVVSMHRFFGGMPMHRQETLQKSFGVRIPDACIWDMCERLADALRPIRRQLWAMAASANLFFGDDTTAVVLNSRATVRKNRKTGKASIRTGCHTSCVIAIGDEGRQVILFKTGIQHTGEMMDMVLEDRAPNLPHPIFMGDCAAVNTVTQAVVIYAGCNAHAVRRFKERLDDFPTEAGFALQRYQAIFKNEEQCKEQKLNAQERLDYHQRNSLPLMREITEHGQNLTEQRKVEPNSTIAQAYNFVINNERRLSAFTRYPHAPLENNLCERTLRICVRLRESSRFFRNLTGSSVADTVLSVGSTAMAAENNLFEYFVAVLRHRADVRERPELWLPWNYQARQEVLRERIQVATGPPSAA